VSALVPPVAVAVVSWNTRDLLDRCLTSLRADHQAGRAEVWVVDNGSGDGSPALVRESHPWARLLERPDNPGFGAAVNEVAARTATEWIAPSNADIAVEPDALAALLGAGRRHPRAGVLAPALVLDSGEVQHSIHPFPTLGSTLAVHAGLGRLTGQRFAVEGRTRLDSSRQVDWAHGAFLLVRREAWDSAGGFDPAMWLYAEDLDLCWRVRRAGWTVGYEPSARVHHHVSAATQQAFGTGRDDRAQEAAYAWMLRRRGRARTAAYAAASLAGSATRAALLSVGARAAPERFSWRRDRARAFARRHRDGLAATRRQGAAGA
jgi:GT2 family glycosyltransferase